LVVEENLHATIHKTRTCGQWSDSKFTLVPYLYCFVRLNLLNSYSQKSVCQLGFVVPIQTHRPSTITLPASGKKERPATGSHSSNLAHATSTGLRLLQVLCIGLTRLPAPCGRAVVGPVARCPSCQHPPAAPAGLQQTRASRAGPGFGGGEVHPPARLVVVTDSVEAMR
jgi:hypothetical protein